MKTLNEIQQQLVTKYAGYAEALALALGQQVMCDIGELCIDMDDLKQESLLGLCEAATRYNPKSTVRFRTMAYHWCRKYVLQAIRKYGVPVSVPDDFEGQVMVVRLDLKPDERDGSESSHELDDEDATDDPLHDEISADEARDQEHREVCRRLVKQVLARLTPRQHEAICCLYGLGPQGGAPMSYADTALQLGLSSTRIMQLEECALKRAAGGKKLTINN